MTKVNDLIGQKFNRLTVLEKVGKNKYNKALWLVRCDCGKEKVIVGNALRNGDTKSCGCLRKELLSTARKGIPKTEETRIKLSIANIGKQAGSNNPNWNPDRELVTTRRKLKTQCIVLFAGVLSIKQITHTIFLVTLPTNLNNTWNLSY